MTHPPCWGGQDEIRHQNTRAVYKSRSKDQFVHRGILYGQPRPIEIDGIADLEVHVAAGDKPAVLRAPAFECVYVLSWEKFEGTASKTNCL